MHETTVESCAGNPRPSHVQAVLAVIWDQMSQVAHWTASGRVAAPGSADEQTPTANTHLQLMDAKQRVKPAFILAKSVSGSEETWG